MINWTIWTGNRIGDEGANRVVEMLKNNRTLSRLELSGEVFYSSPLSKNSLCEEVMKPNQRRITVEMRQETKSVRQSSNKPKIIGTRELCHSLNWRWNCFCDVLVCFFLIADFIDTQFQPMFRRGPIFCRWSFAKPPPPNSIYMYMFLEWKTKIYLISQRILRKLDSCVFRTCLLRFP